MTTPSATGTIRFDKLGYCRLRCPDLAASTAFYRDLVGMTVSQATDSETWLRCSDKPHDIILEAGPEPGLSGVGYELENEGELAKAFTAVENLGLDPRWSDVATLGAMRVKAAFRFADPLTGLELDFYAGQDVLDEPLTEQITKIARMGHVVLNVTDLAAAHRFWVDALGFAVSDRVEGAAEWLRCWPNPLHHSLALLQSDRNTLHHINFMVTDMDDVGSAMNRMKQAEVPIVFGPGRHLPSTSVFLYFLDPDGNTTEFSFGMELFDEDGARDPRDLEHKPEVMDTWGSRPDPRFGKGSRIIPQREVLAHG